MAMQLAASRSLASASVSPRCEAKARPIRKSSNIFSQQQRPRNVSAGAARPSRRLIPNTAAAAAASVHRPETASDLQLSYPPSTSQLFGEPASWDILGLGQTCVDVTAEDAVKESLLQELGVIKGGRRVLGSVDERSSVMDTIEESGSTFKITPGGSLANTLVAIARLSRAAGRSQLNVALGSSCSNDAIGQFFSSQLQQAGVAVLPTSEAPGHTGTVFVLASEDASRSFLSYFHSEALEVTPSLRRAVAKSRLVVIEGYLWELPNAADAIAEVVQIARENGTQVALTAGDPGVVARHRQEILKVLEQGGHSILLFSNTEEASELCGEGRIGDARSAAAQLGSLCSLSVVTDGANGSQISCMGEIYSVPPPEAPNGVVDTCGAGDAYAAGFCYALMMGHDCSVAGKFGGSVAGLVIGRHGAQLLEQEAESLVKLLPAACTFARP